MKIKDFLKKYRWREIQYRVYKNTLILKSQKTNPLIGYPFLIFIEFELDDLYKEGGIELAKKGVKEWIDGFGKRIDNFKQRTTNV